ncbi:MULTISPECIES: hypothetical protein [Eubacteriales]|uniref:DUF5011 domain-containing protein n=1 Tax=Bittarella massiliensis (ex Durand et al. 2017) TaxID=1720313 RepID=A0AAQ1MC68_9FIRM|nr:MULTISPECIES: hypothetical protein [Eubacteriales]ERI99733.1 hypothetical protein HMPREF0262_01507 [Clostridium sp. ATCC 29733]MZL70142.1 hypothetical protein [Bittarella massiliensis (ex Durand et al. 2017)]MZL81154.1 hypothetical protein [Bittarella massiliensis (ex Durand et al. 2017)]SHF83411.1 hypothetical protein SAMN05444424_0854 [Bittarella massiliensis (ex Durand et al. 2017)]
MKLAEREGRNPRRQRRGAKGKPLWSRLGALALAAAFVLTCIPPVQRTAQASVATTDYEKVFKIRNTGGAPTSYNGNGNFTLARTDSPLYWRKNAYNDPSGKTSDSFGGFQTINALSLNCNWTVTATFRSSPPVKDPNNYYTNSDFGFSLNKDPVPFDQGDLYWMWYSRGRGVYSASGIDATNTENGTFRTGWKKDGAYQEPTYTGGPVGAYNNASHQLTLSYNCKKDELTIKLGSVTGTQGYIRQAAFPGGKVYLSVWGQIEWDWNAQIPNMQIDCHFDSFGYPDFDPAIQNITLYKDGTNQVVGANDVVTPGTVLRVESTVKNKASGAGGQTFDLHLKTSDDTKNYPTQGLQFIADNKHPTSVGGTSVTTSKNGYTIDGQYGIPITMVGNTEYKVVYYVKVTESSGQAVKLGQMLEDDVLANRDYIGTTLLNERPLEPLDPDDPASNTQVPGSDYHYTRLPKANENGWNKDDVTVQFFAGDFDQFTITPQTGSAVTLADQESQLYDQEQIYSPITYQAKDTGTGAVSTKVNDLVKVDKTAPTLSFDQDTGVLTATDGLSGVWRLYRKGTDGQFAPVKTFSLTGATGNQSGAGSQTYTATQNGIYLVEDAAGNRSQPLAVQVSEPPVVERPEDPDIPPVGPPLDPDREPVPEGEEPALDPETGLLHRTIEETVTEVISVDPPLYGGSFDRTVVDGMLAYRYAVPAGSTAQVAVKDKEGADITAQGQYLDTTKPGGVDIFYTLTDGDGNTTQIILHYRLVKARPPQVDPADPDAPLPGPEVDPIDPDDPEGPVKAIYKDSLTELIRESGVMDKAAAQALMEERYHFTYPDAAGQSVQVELEDRNGDPIEEIDLTRVGDYLIRYIATDANGNQTAVELSYHLISRVPPVIVPPEDGELVGPTPADPDDPLTPLPDGEEPDPEKPSALLYEDEYTEYIKDSVLDQAAALSWMEERYGASSPVGAALTGSVSLYDSKGDPVEQIDQSRVGDYLLIYTVTDQDGNRVSVKLKYHLISKTPPAVVPSDPEHSLPDPIPLPDPVPGSQKKHWNIRDHLEEEVRSGSWSKADILHWMAQQYTVSSNQADGSLTYDLLLFDQDGRPAEEIDLARPGSCTFYYTATDSVGNTTTVQLTYKLTDRQITGPVGPADPDGADGSGGAPNGGGNSPYTGLLGGRGVGNCWVHWLALLLMAAVALYTIRRRRRTGADAERVGDERPGLLGRDLFFYSLVSALAALLYLLRGCALDGIALLAVAAVVVASAIAVSRRKAEGESEH